MEGFADGSKNLSRKWILAAFVNSITLFCLNPNSEDKKVECVSFRAVIVYDLGIELVP
jgi:hypothetical protein